MKTLLAVLALWLVGTLAFAETLSYEAFTLEADGSRKLITKGTRHYTPEKDIQVVERNKRGSIFWLKTLPLFGPFSLGVHINRDESVLDGFGLVVKERDNPNGFSWEWFVRESKGIFSWFYRGNKGIFLKWQGSGRVKVVTTKGVGYEEVMSVEFLDDITLRYVNDMSRPPDEHSHEIIVAKGSVFCVAP